MRILIHSDEYYPTAQACSYRMQVFVKSFMEMGDDVIVITSSANKKNGTIDRRLHPEKIIYTPTIRMKKKTIIMRLLNNLSFGIMSVFSSLGTGKIDVVITTSPPPLVSLPGWFIAKIKGAKLVYDVRDVWPDVALEMGSFTKGSLFCKIFSAIVNFMYRHADIITTVSLGKAAKIREYVSLLSGGKSGPEHTDKVWLVENGFDEDVEKNDFDQNVIDKYGIDKKITCVYIGNIGLAQGLGALLAVAAKTKHKDIQFLCFGMGAEKEMLEKKVESEGLTNVRFCGVIEHSKVASIFSRSKISFIPLKNGNMKDSVPTKVYEALGLGCPVFLVAEGDSTVIVDETQLGRHVSPDHPEELSRVFDNLVDNYDSIITHKDNAIHLMHDKHSRQKIAKRFEQQLQQLCQAGHP